MYIKRELAKEDFLRLMKNSTSFITNHALSVVYEMILDNEKEEFLEGWEFNFKEIEEGFQEIEDLQEKNIYNFDYCYILNNGNFLLTNLIYTELEII